MQVSYRKTRDSGAAFGAAVFQADKGEDLRRMIQTVRSAVTQAQVTSGPINVSSRRADRALRIVRVTFGSPLPRAIVDKVRAVFPN